MPKDGPTGVYKSHRGVSGINSDKNFEKAVNDLREYAYKLQSRFHKPGFPIDEEFKSDGYTRCGHVVATCMDATYMVPDDFYDQEKAYRKDLDNLKDEMDEKEAKHKEWKMGNALR